MKGRIKGRINKSGLLYIERTGKTKLQECPLSKDSACGDWCPLFKDPAVSRWTGSIDPDEKDRESNPKDWDVKICRTTLYFDELTDER